jgi:glycosyltransferase involved in cell wall biosynthesis
VGAFEFYKDPTHLNPLPSDVIAFIVEYMGFENVKVEYLHPFPDNTPLPLGSQLERDYLIWGQTPNREANLKQTSTNQKPTLAYISPMPPQKTGISDYSAELLPYLSKYYTIEVISEPTQRPSSPNYGLRTPQWFEHHHTHYDRVIYHIGNSPYHTYMLNLLSKRKGIIVLHDFYLGDLMLHAGLLDQNLLFTQYGKKALNDYETKNIKEIIDQYPCNKTILTDALSIITHSTYPKELAQKWYPNLPTDSWSTIPLLRTPPSSKIDSITPYQIPPNSFVVATFGLLSPNKMNQELLESWIDSSLHYKSNCYLLFVGENLNSTYTQKLKETIKGDHIIITGYTSPQEFQSYLQNTDVAVQLRSNSRGETSAATLDTMNYAIPTIINNNGSNRELPKNALYMLNEEFTQTELTQALETLYHNPAQRELLAQNAKEYIQQHHNPEACATLYHQTIESTYQKAKR